MGIIAPEIGSVAPVSHTPSYLMYSITLFKYAGAPCEKAVTFNSDLMTTADIGGIGGTNQSRPMACMTKLLLYSTNSSCRLKPLLRCPSRIGARIRGSIHRFTCGERGVFNGCWPTNTYLMIGSEARRLGGLGLPDLILACLMTGYSRRTEYNGLNATPQEARTRILTPSKLLTRSTRHQDHTKSPIGMGSSASRVAFTFALTSIVCFGQAKSNHDET
jgi:hypothetical protein